jgi:menaquinone reductase, multiheme cytochrome c subunit
VFPKWTNYLGLATVVLAGGGALYLGILVPYALSPTTLNVGFQPPQPLAYSHAQHVGKLGMDCRYCHYSIEVAAFAALPPAQACWNCHGLSIAADGSQHGPGILWTSEKMLPLKQYFTADTPIPWAKVHDFPDFAYFDHGVHLAAGVGCVECHGRIDKMEVVAQAENLSMGFCLTCHRNPKPKVRPISRVWELGWDRKQMTDIENSEVVRLQDILKSPRQLTDCSICHR